MMPSERRVQKNFFLKHLLLVYIDAKQKVSTTVTKKIGPLYILTFLRFWLFTIFGLKSLEEKIPLEILRGNSWKLAMCRSKWKKIFQNDLSIHNTYKMDLYDPKNAAEMFGTFFDPLYPFYRHQYVILCQISRFFRGKG